MTPPKQVLKKCREIAEPTDARSILIMDENGVMNGEGAGATAPGISWCCPKCARVFMRNIAITQIVNVAFKCGECGTFSVLPNYTFPTSPPSRPAGRPPGA